MVYGHGGGGGRVNHTVIYFISIFLLCRTFEHFTWLEGRVIPVTDISVIREMFSIGVIPKDMYEYNVSSSLASKSDKPLEIIDFVPFEETTKV